MRASQAFPGKYLKADDIPEGKSVGVVIDRVVSEVLTNEGVQENKWVMYFRGKERGIVLNKTNWSACEDVYGDSDDWPGKPVEIYSAMVQFGAKMVAAIRLRVPRGGGRLAPAPSRPVPQQETVPPELDGAFSDADIPF